MRIDIQGGTLKVSEVRELGASSAGELKDKVRTQLGDRQNIDIDLGETSYIDSCGIGTLIGLRKLVANREGVVRVLNPQPSVRQILRLTQMDRVFEIVNNPP